MVFYLPEPNAREDKPAFNQMPEALLRDIEDVIQGIIIKSEIAWGGYSPTFSVIVENQNHQKFFIKGSYPDHRAHGYKILSQEIHVYQKLKALKHVTPDFIGYVSYGSEDDWHLGIWRAIEGAHLKKTLRLIDIEAIFKRFDLFYKSVDFKDAEKFLKYGSKTNFVKDIISGQNSWIKFHNNIDRQNNFIAMFDNPNAGQVWLNQNLDNLIESSTQHNMNHKQSVVNFDMRLDNIVFDSENIPFIIDWPDACIAPVGYDVINLCINIMVESGQEASEVLSRFSTISGIGIPKEEIISILSKLSGYYALQAYRLSPARLPRLRWMQKAMLWGSVSWLFELTGQENLPKFKKTFMS